MHDDIGDELLAYAARHLVILATPPEEAVVGPGFGTPGLQILVSMNTRGVSHSGEVKYFCLPTPTSAVEVAQQMVGQRAAVDRCGAGWNVFFLSLVFQHCEVCGVFL